MTKNRKYPRADFHDYNGGAYFITVCTEGKKHYFGEIVNGEMELSAIGKALDHNIADIERHHDDVEIPLWVVMPNHFHAIVYVDPTASPRDHTADNIGRLNQLGRISIGSGLDPTLTTHHNSRLSVTVGGIKAHVTRYARKHNMEFGWHARFYEHIIRWYELNRIVEYVNNNVVRWAYDQFFNEPE